MKVKQYEIHAWLRCIECEQEYSINHIHVCEFRFRPLEAIDDSKKIRKPVYFRKIEENQIDGGGQNGS